MGEKKSGIRIQDPEWISQIIFRPGIRDGKIRIRYPGQSSRIRNTEYLYVRTVPLHAEAGAEAPEVERDHLTAGLEKALPPLALVLLAQVNLTTNGETTVWSGDQSECRHLAVYPGSILMETIYS